jgi:hypothetical protein
MNILFSTRTQNKDSLPCTKDPWRFSHPRRETMEFSLIERHWDIIDSNNPLSLREIEIQKVVSKTMKLNQL